MDISVGAPQQIIDDALRCNAQNELNRLAVAYRRSLGPDGILEVTRGEYEQLEALAARASYCSPEKRGGLLFDRKLIRIVEAK